MIISRGTNVLKLITQSTAIKKAAPNLQLVRLSHGPWSYRYVPPPNKNWVIAAEFLGGFMWWWILYHIYHDFDHLIGEFDYPDPSKWTDEELGIPPDNV